MHKEYLYFFFSRSRFFAQKYPVSETQTRITSIFHKYLSVSYHFLYKITNNKYLYKLHTEIIMRRSDTFPHPFYTFFAFNCSRY